MNRRRFCCGLLSGTLVGVSGCIGVGFSEGERDGAGGGSDRSTTDRGSSTSTPRTTTTTPERTTTTEIPKLAEFGYPSDICEADVVEDFSIQAIVDPAFVTDWADHEIDPRYTREDADALTDDAVVVGRERDGRARAYPISVLWFHEVVNDTLDDPLLVTYCSICRTGLVAERRVEGEPTLFGVSGQLWRPPDRFIRASAEADRAFGADRWNASDPTPVRNGANLVMYDQRTRSFWSQAVGQAICGPATGTRLQIVPFTLTSWGDWRDRYPDTVVLLPPPASSVDPN